LAEKLLTALKQKISSFELEPSSGGCFELTVDGKVLYSKIETDEFPDESDIVSKLVAM